MRLKALAFSLTLLTIVAATLVQAKDRSTSSPLQETQFIQLTEGIVGGIVGACPTLRILVERKQKNRLQVWVWHKGVSSKGQVDAARAQTFFKKLAKQRAFALPTENPVGGEDMYRLNYSLHWHSKVRCWQNQGPSGCCRAPSKIRPTADERERFEQLVRLVQNLAKQSATTKIKYAEFDAAWKIAHKQHQTQVKAKQSGS